MMIVGFVGWRGMVGSVLMQRLRAEKDFALIEPIFFSTHTAGSPAPADAKNETKLHASTNIDQLRRCDAIISCQGSDYTRAVLPPLRAASWGGYWIDAASALRMTDDAIIILDPVNANNIRDALTHGIKNYIGGNCTVSLMMMALAGLFQAHWIEWISVMSYQAASGAGAQAMRELLQQMGVLANAAGNITDPATAMIDMDRQVSAAMHDAKMPITQFGAPLAGSLIPWIDEDMGNGVSREEWKGNAETNKILGHTGTDHDAIGIDGLCVRIGAMRCHSQALTIKLKQAVPLDEIEAVLASANDSIKIIPNTREATMAALTPAQVAGTLSVPVGRLRKLAFGDHYLSAFTVGDQLLWGAAEPLRRMLRILLER
jgi:aspartate-semialdehyde dehydrogenase